MLARSLLHKISLPPRIYNLLINAMAPKRKLASGSGGKREASPGADPARELAATEAAEAAPAIEAAAAGATEPVIEATEPVIEANAAVAMAPAKKKKKATAEAAPPGPVFDHSMRPPPLEGPGFRVLSWNVAGLRALLKEEKKVDLGALAEAHGADVLCLQEIKLQEGKHCEEARAKLGLEGWHCTWNCSIDKKGYSGTAVLSKQKPLSVTCGIGKAEHDGEGRVVTAEFDDLYVVNCYTPNSGDGLKRLNYRVGSWDKDFSAYVKALGEKKGVIVAGDLNCAHQEIDIHNPKGNLRSAGFTQEERDSFAANLLGQGFVDAFRQQYPGVVAYSYWGYRFNLRAKNKGWRLDYALVSESLWNRVHECYHCPEVMGSDHCPVVLVLKLTP